MVEVKIEIDDGRELSAQVDNLPREGDRLLIADAGIGAPETSYTVSGVDFHLRGPGMYFLQSITVRVKKIQNPPLSALA